jgi:hypothetical protein
VEGGLLAPDLLDRIYEGTAPGQKPVDFGHTGRLESEIAAVWQEAREHWRAFQHRLERLPENDPATTVTRDQWVIPLLSLLGYELVYTPRAAEVEGKTYAISHRAGRGEGAPPVHVVGCRQSLDRRSESGRPRLAPHSLVQEYLNRTEHLWGVVTNGFTFRLLRDNFRRTQAAYIEFDLREIMAGENFADFSLFYRLAHRTRLPQDGALDCWLERYYLQTLEQGHRVRDRLRDGVEEAIKTLGRAFLRHPANEGLREKVRAGQLDAAAYYQQLLRLVYRLLFLMVAEERELLTTNETYRKYYSVARVRRLCENRRAYTEHGDLWEAAKVTFLLLAEGALGEKLGLPPLDGPLFDPRATEDLNDLQLTNRAFLEAVWHLCMYRENERAPWRPVNYAALDVEELGSVYESLLDFHPVITDAEGDVPDFGLDPGTERKSTGSYYTPRALVQELVASALVPVLEERLAGKSTTEEKRAALLSVKVCDPACGSGHFLLAAARRLGQELARIDSRADEPAPEEIRKALREVIAHCIYGVDKNPMAVELCKVALWIEAHTPGKPLTFLDHRIRCGDSLVGVLDLAVLRKGIPDEAYDPVGDDDRDAARSLKRQNRTERSGQMKMPPPVTERPTELISELLPLLTLPDDTPEQVRRKGEAYARLRQEGTEWWGKATACHLWTGAFFAPLTHIMVLFRAVPTTADLFDLLGQPREGYLTAWAWEMAEKHRFFHWPLEFPEVFQDGGFDVVLSNPPFMGGLKISGTFGSKYRHWLQVEYEPFKGTADLCAAFYRRAFELLRSGGMLGMVATNTIGQGDTREGGLAVILRRGGAITFARRFIKWPGIANVEVNLVAICRGKSTGKCLLDGQSVDFISSRLDDEPEVEPRRLRQNEGKAFQGSIVLGMGFVLEPHEAEYLIIKDTRNADCLFPYLNGEDLNSDPEQKPSRFVICFHDWDLDRARQYPDLLRIVEERVKPEREKLRDTIPIQAKRKKFWWQFGSPAVQLYKAIAPLRRVLVIARITEHFGLVFVPKGWIYNEKTIVFAFDDDYYFAVLQSTIHELWARKYSSTLESRFNYTPTDCFDTFPFPQNPSSAAKKWATELGAEYHEHRRQIMLSRRIGLTATYNLFHHPTCTDEDVQRLRELHAEMDRAILACYGWDDIDPQHGFCQNERGQVRFTVSPQARREILRRLVELNMSISRVEGTKGRSDASWDA